MEWANYIRRHSFFAHLLFSLSLEHYLPASTLEAKLHNNTEEVLCPLCLERDYFYKLGAFGYRSIDVAQWGQHCHCAMLSGMCAQGELVIGEHLCASPCGWLQRNSLAASPVRGKIDIASPVVIWDGFLKLCDILPSAPNWFLAHGILIVAFVEVLPLP